MIAVLHDAKLLDFTSKVEEVAARSFYFIWNLFHGRAVKVVFEVAISLLQRCLDWLRTGSSRTLLRRWNFYIVRSAI